jgi:hypothetical protein
MSSSHIPDIDVSAWLKVNLSILKKNLLSLDAEKNIIDLTPPFLSKAWQYIEEDVIRLGINIIASKNPQDLLRADNHFLKILLPGFSKTQLGYAAKNIIPVISSHEEILALSNLAQENDARISFLIKIQTLNKEFSSGTHGYYDLIGKIRMLPMVDFAGIFFDVHNSKSFNQKSFINDLKKASDKKDLLLISCEDGTDLKGGKMLTSWPVAGICQKVMPLAISAGFIAYPVEKIEEEIIFKIELGLRHGLPEKFPALIEQFNVEVKETRIYNTILGVKDFVSERPYPYQGIFIGRQSGENISQHQWNQTLLKNFLLHFKQKTIFLI